MSNCKDCGILPKELPRHTCYWCGLLKATADVQSQAALERRSLVQADAPRTRPAASWPVGMRWCGGCYSFVGLRYCGTSSRCHGCQVIDRRKAAFGLDSSQQSALSAISGGKCQGCMKAQRIKALAVDHDHYNQLVRGLLCQDDNQVVGAFFNDPMRFLRLAIYLVNPPATQVGIGQPMGRKETIDLILQMTEQILNERKLA